MATTTGSCDLPAPENPRVVVCVLRTNAVGDVATITVDAQVTAPAGSSLSAVVLVDSSSIDDHRGDNIAILETAVA